MFTSPQTKTKDLSAATLITVLLKLLNFTDSYGKLHGPDSTVVYSGKTPDS